MLHSDYFEKFHPKEYLVEEMYVVENTSGPYLELKWCVEDPDPNVDWYLTDDGSLAKNRIERDGKTYIVTDYSKIARN